MVLVTGATGFLGSHLVCHLLLNGYHVRGLKRPNSRMTEFEYISEIVLKDKKSAILSNLKWHDGDLNNYFSLDEALTDIDVVFHCAALVSFHHQDRDLLLKVNAEGTANLVNACLRNGIQDFCHISSTATIGSSDDTGILSEENIWKLTKKTSQYSVSKHLAEMEVWRGEAEGLNVFVLNPPIIIGPGFWKRGTCRFFYNAFNQFPFYSAGTNSFVDAGDVCRAAILLYQEKCYGERFIISGATLSFKDFLFEIADRMQTKKPWLKVEENLVGIAWRLFRIKEFLSGKRSMITKESAQSSVSHKSYSSNKLTERLNFVFRDIHQTIAESAVLCRKWMEENRDRK